MPRIPDVDVARLKSSVPLTDLAAAAGIELAGQGRNLIGRCPFHDDKTPSFIIDPEKNLWNCLGACQAGGSNVDFVMKLNGVGFRDACSVLAARAEMALPAASAATASTTAKRQLANPFTPDARGDVLLGQVAEVYHRTLVDDPLATASAALNYLAERKIGDPALIRQFGIGFSDRSMGLRLPEKNRRAGAEIRLRLAQIGILKSSGHDWFTGAVTFPLVNEDGITVGMYGRMITAGLRPGTVLHRYLPGPHRAAWNAAHAVNAAGQIIVCESIIDALTLAGHGFPNVTAAYGINGFTQYHRALCTGSTVKAVYIAYDNDDAGNRAAATLADELMVAGKTVYRVVVPDIHKDLNAFACAHDNAAAALADVMRDAVFVGGSPRVSVGESAEECRPADENFYLAAKKETTADTATNDDEPIVIMDEERPPELPSAVLRSSVSVVQSPAPSSVLISDGDDYRATFGNRSYRIRALLKNADLSALKIGLRLTVGAVFHQDSVDLCQAKQRAAFIASAADITKVDAEAIKADVAKILDASEVTWLAQRNTKPDKSASRTMTDSDRETALQFLHDPQLLSRIAADYETCGLVGDSAPKVVSYLCAISRKLAQPLAVLTMAPSAAGKSSLQDATLAFVPEEDALVLSTLTGQALYYSDTDLRHKVLAIAEEEGASRASYALKLLQSDGKLSLAVPIKDGDSGQIATQIKTVHGPVALFLTTTAPQINDELANRCIVLTVDDSAQHTARVQHAQRERETLLGLHHATAATAIRTVHQNAQRLLTAVAVVNPFAPALTFRADRARMRRDHMKYLSLIRVVTFLHQHQRPLKSTVVQGKTVSYIETTLSDVAAANDLAAAVLGRSLDELAPQTRALLMKLNDMVTQRAAREARARETIRFTRRAVREFSGWSADQIDIHMKRLERFEYVVCGRRENAGALVYTLDYHGQGQDGSPFVLGITDVATIPARMQQLSPTGTTNRTESANPQFRPHTEAVPRAVRGRSVGDEIAISDGENSASSESEEITLDHGMNKENNQRVHRHRTLNGHAVLGAAS